MHFVHGNYLLRQLLILLICSASFQSILLWGMLRKCSSFRSAVSVSSQSMRKRVSSFWPILADLRSPRGMRRDLDSGLAGSVFCAHFAATRRVRDGGVKDLVLGWDSCLALFGGDGVAESLVISSDACSFGAGGLGLSCLSGEGVSELAILSSCCLRLGDMLSAFDDNSSSVALLGDLRRGRHKSRAVTASREIGCSTASGLGRKCLRSSCRRWLQ